jgi:hypothetical protein
MTLKGLMVIAMLAGYSLPIAALMSCARAASQVYGEHELASMLARERTRRRAIAEIRDSGGAKIPLLLSWALTPPADVDGDDLKVGLADAFGQLKVSKAIPFLIGNICLRRSVVDLQPWLKVDSVILRSFPSIAALIEIGPDASRELMKALKEPMRPEDRLAAIFVISHISDVPEALPFLP